MRFDITEGWTAPLAFQLKADGVALPLGGATVELILKDRNGAAVDTSGDLAVTDAAAGKVEYSPDANDLASNKSPYLARFKVTDGAGKVAFFPAGAADQWHVHRQ